MKLFQMRDVVEAQDYADAGGQALHVWNAEWPNLGGKHTSAPTCFQRSKEWGHLLDRDTVRLVMAARRVGVKAIVIGRHGKRGQHVDLCGQPLERAKKECEKESPQKFLGTFHR